MLERLLVGVEVLDRVRVEFATVLLDRLADLPWVGREQERREVKEIRLQVEQIANAGPVPEVGDGRRLVAQFTVRGLDALLTAASKECGQ